MQSGKVGEKQTAVSPIASPIFGQPPGDAMGEVVAGVAKVSSHRIAPTVGNFVVLVLGGTAVSPKYNT